MNEPTTPSRREALVGLGFRVITLITLNPKP